MKVKVSENKAVVEEIRTKLANNKEQYGKAYCPCVLPTFYLSDNSSDYICMCKEFRDQIANGTTGECHCGLYVAVND